METHPRPGPVRFRFQALKVDMINITRVHSMSLSDQQPATLRDEVGPTDAIERGLEAKLRGESKVNNNFIREPRSQQLPSSSNAA